MYICKTIYEIDAIQATRWLLYIMNMSGCPHVTIALKLLR